jgi:hypothetical protein
MIVKASPFCPEREERRQRPIQVKGLQWRTGGGALRIALLSAIALVAVWI